MSVSDDKKSITLEFVSEVTKLEHRYILEGNEIYFIIQKETPETVTSETETPVTETSETETPVTETQEAETEGKSSSLVKKIKLLCTEIEDCNFSIIEDDNQKIKTLTTQVKINGVIYNNKFSVQLVN